MPFAALESPDVMQVYDTCMATNVRPVLLLSHLVAPHLIKTKGNIINLSTIASTNAFLNLLPYGAAKAAVDMLSKGMALELGPKGVRVNTVR